MGQLVRFPRRRHGRASKSASTRRAPSSAKMASVSSLWPWSDARRATAAQCELGMPRSRQPDTVDLACESAPASALVPPRASMIEGQVQIIDPKIVRTARTSQAFANCETTFRGFPVEMSVMDANDDVARRLIAVREHHQMSQVEFAAELNIEKNTLNGFERGKRSLTMVTAKRIRQRFGVSIDWLLFGDIGQPWNELVTKLGPRPATSKDKAPTSRKRVANR